MAVVTSKLDATMLALADGLALRAGLSGVQIATGPLGGDSAQESIQLFTGSLDQEFVTTNRRREELLTIEGAIWVMRAGKDDTVIRVARARAIALLAEIETFLRDDPSIGATVRAAEVQAVSLDQGVNPDGRWCQLDFTLAASQRLNT